jgi:hypothetical protein
LYNYGYCYNYYDGGGTAHTRPLCCRYHACLEVGHTMHSWVAGTCENPSYTVARTTTSLLTRRGNVAAIPSHKHRLCCRYHALIQHACTTQLWDGMEAHYILKRKRPATCLMALPKVVPALFGLGCKRVIRAGVAGACADLSHITGALGRPASVKIAQG